VILIEDMVKKYKLVTALNGIDLFIDDGECVAIMGPSGSGKTTLVNLIAGLDTPSAGKIRIGDHDISAMSHDQRTAFRRENIGIVFQQFYLIPYLTALENVMLAQYLHSLPDRSEALAALDRVGLADRAKHRPGQLSGGEQQRVAIARAIINDPAVLLTDEPTGNLDAENEAIVLDIFRQLKTEGKTIVIVTHNREVAQVSDRIVSIHHGKISESQPLTHLVSPKCDQSAWGSK
jgi:putative ABC transport system ATP-binding protein